MTTLINHANQLKINELNYERDILYITKMFYNKIKNILLNAEELHKTPYDIMSNIEQQLQFVFKNKTSIFDTLSAEIHTMYQNMHKEKTAKRHIESAINAIYSTGLMSNQKDSSFDYLYAKISDILKIHHRNQKKLDDEIHVVYASDRISNHVNN